MSTKDETGIVILEVDEHGMIKRGEFTVAIPTDANKFSYGCELIGNDGKLYTNQALSSAAADFQDVNSIVTSEIVDGAVTLAKLASGITPSHILKFFKLGSTITGTTLTGVVAGDLVVTIVADGTVTVGTVVTPDTLPADPADTSYVLVFRAAA